MKKAFPRGRTSCPLNFVFGPSKVPDVKRSLVSSCLRFGSGHGRSWRCFSVSRGRLSPGPVSFLRGPSLEEARNRPETRPKRKGTYPRTGSDLKITLRQVSPPPSWFWDFGSLHQKPRVGGPPGCVRRHGSDGWRSRVPWGDNTGGEIVYLLRQPSHAGLADRFRTS